MLGFLRAFLLCASASGSEVEVSELTLCSAGRYVDADGNCAECPFGKFSKEEDAKPCRTCPAEAVCHAGKYRDNKSIQCHCTKCPPGKYNPDASTYRSGETSCFLCPAGKYASEHGGHRQCNLCHPGKQSRDGSSYCKKVQPERTKSKLKIEL